MNYRSRSKTEGDSSSGGPQLLGAERFDFRPRAIVHQVVPIHYGPIVLTVGQKGMI